MRCRRWTGPTAPGHSIVIVETEAHLNRHLEGADRLTCEVPTDVGDFEPIEVVKRLRSASGRALNCVVYPVRRGPDDLCHSVHVLGHDTASSMRRHPHITAAVNIRTPTNRGWRALGRI